MKQLKTIIAAAGVVGLVAMFVLPYVQALPLKYWDMHDMPGGNAGILNGPKQVYVALICFAVPLLLGLVAIATKQLQRWMAAIAGVFSLLAFALEGVRKGLLGESDVATAIGGKLLFIAAAVGLVTAIVGVIKPERA